MWSRVFPSFTALILHIQYTVGYVATGFLVSVPIQLVWVEQWNEVVPSLVRGGIGYAFFFLFYPIVRTFDWENMKLPEFKLFELTVTRNATLLSFALMLVSFFDEIVGTPHVLWLLTLLEGVAYLKIKAHTLIFREFYAIEEARHRQEWHEELRSGLRTRASQVGDRVLEQARGVQSQLRAQIRQLVRRVGADMGLDEMYTPPPEPPPPVLSPMPCRYVGRSGIGRRALPKVSTEELAQAEAEYRAWCENRAREDEKEAESPSGRSVHAELRSAPGAGRAS